MGLLCSCFQKPKPECLVTLLGLEEDQRRVLVHMVGRAAEKDGTSPYSNHKVEHAGIIFDIQRVSPSENIAGIREIHKSLCTAVVYSIDAENKASIDMFKSQIKEGARNESEIVLVLCRADNIEDPNSIKIKGLYSPVVPENYEFVLYNENTCGRVKRGFSWIHDKVTVEKNDDMKSEKENDTATENANATSKNSKGKVNSTA